MSKSNFNRILDSISVKYVMANKRQVIRPVMLEGTTEPKDIIIQVNSGYFGAGKNNKRIQPGDFYLAPKGTEVYFFHGDPPYASLGSEGFVTVEQREEYLKPLDTAETGNPNAPVFSILGFDVLIHDSIPLFSMLDIPCMNIGSNPHLTRLMGRIMEEESKDELGKNAIIKKCTEAIAIYVCRVLYDTPELKENIKKADYLLDKRLIDIFQYINDNLGSDLSNIKIAELAYVSKDYIGQFFKALTNSNLQEYIENRRLDRAHYLLRNSKASIQEIALKVGFKDPAYFSRRFKIRFNINAKEVRKSEYQIL